MKTLLATFLFASTIISVCGQTVLTPKKIVTTIGEYYGYANSSGEMIIPAQFKEAQLFYNGLARVKNDKDLYGFINETGEVVIPFKYNFADDFYWSNNFGKKKEVGLSQVAILVTEEVKKKHNLGEVYYNGQSSTTTRKVRRKGIINLKGEYVVPLNFEGDAKVEGDFAKIQFSKNRESFSALLDAEGNVRFGPVPGGIDVTENNIIVIYNNAAKINGSLNFASELYDLDGNRLFGVEKRYGLMNESANPKFLDVERVISKGDEVIYKYGLIDIRGNEIIKTLYERIIWENDLKLFRVIIKSDEYNDNGELGVFFYANEKGECIAKGNVPCPAPPPAGFDYEAYVSEGHSIVKNLNATAEIPWLNDSDKLQANASTPNTVKEDGVNAGVGPIFSEMNGTWVETPVPAQNGTIFKINKIQKNAVCGDYKRFAGTQISEAKLKCIHADETGFVFHLEFYNRPSYARGQEYLHVSKKVKKEKVTYKCVVFNGLIDKSFEQQKILYHKYVQTAELGRKGYNSSWWFWSVYK